MKRLCHLRNLHRVTYENGMQMQETLVGLRQRDEIPDHLLLLEHPPVITLGRGGDTNNLLADAAELKRFGVRFYETTRGGDITYHGPGQIMGYPIIHMGEGNRDVRKYVTKLEEVLIITLAEYGVAAQRQDGRRGVWVGNEKVAAIGVRIARWVTSHGFALNVSSALDHFSLITPCGLRGTGVTSVQRLTGRDIQPDEVRVALGRIFAEVFERELVDRKHEMRIVKVVAHDQERVLLLHRRVGDFWQPITGRIEEGETEQAAASRELREESGLEGPLSTPQLRQSFLISAEFLSQASSQPCFAEETTFGVLVSRKLPVRLDQEEHDGHGWFTFDEAYAKIRWSDDRDSLERIQKCLASDSPIDVMATRHE